MMKLEPRTLALIERLFATDWFEHVGEPLPANVYAVRGWAEAVEFARDPDEVFHVARGEYTVRMHQTAPRRYQRWNDIMVVVKSAVVSRTNERIDALTPFLDPPARKEIRDQVRWSILHACMESEYLDVIPAGFFLPLMDWYVAGRFPCGWFGKYPEGALAVY